MSVFFVFSRVLNLNTRLYDFTRKKKYNKSILCQLRSTLIKPKPRAIKEIDIFFSFFSFFPTS